jgi:transposase-like protein
MKIGLACPGCDQYNVRPSRVPEYRFSPDMAVRLFICQDCRRIFMVRYQVVTEDVALELEELFYGPGE